ncbi:CHAD domain-containing protein [Guyparkeria sp.]|uniref:CHAD domain-containing protein n=1 Tax=Guyparkeria sp. TaxID=2035736 RepID=UPI0039705D0F
MGKAKKHARKLDADFPSRPAGEVASTLVAAQEVVFRNAWEHYCQCADDDPEALHDLRVELRRLRVWLKLSRDVIRTRKSTRKRLKALARASSPARDREVMMTLLEQLARDPDVGEAGERLIRLADEHDPPSRQRLAFEPKPGLKPRPRDQTPPFVDWFTEQLDGMLDLIRRDMDEGRAGAHATRIQVKYLRYLVEPMSEPFAGVVPLLKDLKSIQDRLGDVHDVVVFRGHIPRWAGWLVEEALPGALERPGKQTRAVTQSFAEARTAVIGLAGWQDARLNALWKDWEAARPALEGRLVRGVSTLAADMRKVASGAD